MNLLYSLAQDARYAWRLWAKSPGFVAIAVLSIGFGTGANVAMFSAADALLLRPLPVERPDELFTVGTGVGRGLETLTLVSYPDFEDIRDRNKSFDGLAVYGSRPLSYGAQAGAVLRPQVTTFVNAGFFRALRVEPMLGRTFDPSEDAVPGRDAVVVLSHGLWLRDFSGDPTAVGRTIRIGGIDFTIVGVLPQAFSGLEYRYVRDAAYVPMAMLPSLVEPETDNPLRARGLRTFTLKGRLLPGRTKAQAQAELDTLSRDMARQHPDTNLRTTFVVQSELQLRFQESRFDAGLVAVLTTLSIAVLAVACANVAGLLASRATVRGREIALRLAVGAGRVRIVRQLLIESFGIAIAGGGLGVAVGYAGIRVINQIRMPTDVFAYPEFRLDERALVFTLIVAGASAFLFGLVPALQTARVNLIDGLRSSDPDSGRRRPMAARSLFVATQVALSLVLVAIAVFSVQTFRVHFDRGPGFRTARAAKITLDAGSRRSPAAVVRFYDEALAAVRRLPGVTSVSVTSAMPLFSFQPGTLVPEGYDLPPGQTGMDTYFNCVDEAYFSTLEIPLQRGRGFRVTDDADAPHVAIVNEVAARKYWPGKDPLGRRFRLADAGGQLVEVIGVAKTTKYHYFLEPAQEMVYLPFRQAPRSLMVLVAATASASATVVPLLAPAVALIDRNVTTSDAQTMEGFYAARTTMFSTLGLQLVGAMSLMGLILTTVGLYGLVSYAASRRTREIGIRIAIGATASRVIRLVLGYGMRPAWGGLALGVILNAAVARLLPQLVPLELQRHGDTRSVLLAAPLLLLVSLVAALIPARRSARVDPTMALRCE
jgi:putative ABC transport system permease protein